MKKILSILCLAATCAATGATVQAPGNLLQNPSFADAGEPDAAAAGWKGWGGWLGREDARSPAHGGKCLIGYHHGEVTGDKDSGLWQDVTTVRTGQKLRFSVFVAADAPDAGHPAQEVELRLEATRHGREVTIASTITPVADLQTAPGWHELSVTGTTPENNVRVLVVFTPAATERGGAVKVDDAKLEVVR